MHDQEPILPPPPSFVYIGGRGFGTHSNAVVKCSLINYFELFSLLNKNLVFKFLYKKEKNIKISYITMFYMRLKMCVEQCKKTVKK